MRGGKETVEFGSDPLNREARDHTLAPQTRVDHYEVLRRAGQGGMAEVYAARDVNLGRKVALKLLSPRILSTPNALEQFTREARLLASFNHPHIVAIYGVGRFGEVPYIAMEYLEGETLRTRYESEVPTQREVVRVGLAVAAALSEAHKHGIIHGDLKPENLIMASDGRPRVVDFGLANRFADAAKSPMYAGKGWHALETQSMEDVLRSRHSEAVNLDTNGGELLAGTPAYVSPEQWELKPRTPAIDIWAFGVILFELLAGKRPFEPAEKSILNLAAQVGGPEPAPNIAARREVDEPLAHLINQCLQKDPASRPSAAEVVETLTLLLHGRAAVTRERESPFRGLAAFGEEHAALFFGRDDEISAFMERLRQEAVLPVIGASGVGKSSFVQAGVVPRMRERSDCSVIRVRPGTDPFRALAVRLAGSPSGDTVIASRSPIPPTAGLTIDSLPSDPIRIAQTLHDNPKLLALYLRRQAQREGHRVVLVVDQLEEICTLVADREVRLRYLAAVCGAADDRADSVRVIFTARDDFLSRIAESPEARACLTRVTVLRPPGAEALRAILDEPIKVVGYSYDDPTLTADMVKAVVDTPSALPLLQFAGTMLWERADHRGRKLSRSAYQAIGGVQGALATHANAFLRELSARQVSLVRGAMLRLVTPEGTRRLSSQRDLTQALGDGADHMLQLLVNSRLLVVRDSFGENHLEIAHESLVQTWDRLAEWLSEGREELVFLAELEQAATLWDKRGRRNDEVWVAQALAEALRNIDRFRCRLPDTAAAFISACSKAERRRRTIRRGVGTAGVTLLTLIAVVSFVTAIRFAEKTRVAQEQRSQAQAEGARSAYQRGDYVAARAQLRSSMETQDSALARSLLWKLEREPVFWRVALPNTIYDVAISPDRRTMAAGCMDRSVYLVDSETTELESLRELHDLVLTVAYSPDGKWLAAADISGVLGLWAMPGRAFQKVQAHAVGVWKVAFSPDNRLIATAASDGKVRIWRTGDLALVREIPIAQDALYRAEFSPDGKMLAVGTSRGDVELRNVDSGDKVALLQGGHRASVMAATFSADGRWLATGSEDKTIVIWNVATHAVEKRWIAHDAAVTDLSFFGNDGSLLSVSYDAKLKRWSVPGGQPLGTWSNHQSGISAVATDGKSKIVTSGSGDKTLISWNLEAGGSAEAKNGHDGPVQEVRFTPDGLYALSASDDHTVRMWEISSGREVRRFVGHADVVKTLAVSADGKMLATGSFDKTIRLWQLATAEPIRDLRGHDNAVFEVLFSANDRELISVAHDKTLRVWDVATGVARQVTKLESAPYSLASAKAFFVAPTLEGHHYFWNDIRQPPVKRAGGGYGSAYRPDGRNYVLSTETGSVELYTTEGKHIGGTTISKTHGCPGSFDPTGETIGMGFVDGARVWPWQHPELARKLEGHIGEVTDVAFDPTATLALTAGDDGTVRLFDVATGRPRWHAAAFLLSSFETLTHRGWRSLVGAPIEASPRNQRLAQVARWAEEAGGPICIQKLDGGFAMWSQNGDPIETGINGAVNAVRATRSGCVVVAASAARSVGTDGTVRTLSDHTSAVSVEGDGIVVAASGQVVVFENAASPGRRFAAGADITAVGAWDGAVATGFSNGNIELIEQGTGRRTALRIENQPSSAAVRLAAGPTGTMIAAYADGTVGLWGLGNGSELSRMKLHGPAVAILRRDARIYALSALGDSAELDVALLADSYCNVLRRAWASASSVWVGGRAVPADVPSAHDCR